MNCTTRHQRLPWTSTTNLKWIITMTYKFIFLNISKKMQQCYTGLIHHILSQSCVAIKHLFTYRVLCLTKCGDHFIPFQRKIYMCGILPPMGGEDTLGDSTLVTVVEVRLSQREVARHTWVFHIAPSSLSRSGGSFHQLAWQRRYLGESVLLAYINHLFLFCFYLFFFWISKKNLWKVEIINWKRTHVQKDNSTDHQRGTSSLCPNGSIF